MGATLLISSTWFTPYAVGGLVVGFAWLVHWFLWTGDGAASQRVGSEAQGWTREEFEKLGDEGWRTFGPIEFTRGDKEFDVDLIAVGPRGVLAVETKYTSGSRLTERNAKWTLDRALWQAERGAKDIEQLLSEGDTRTPVKPVLVLWGPDVPDFGAGWKSPNGVTVVSGRQAKLWRQKLREGSLSKADRDAIALKLREVVARGPVAA